MLILSILVALIVFVYYKFFRWDSEEDYQIENTPLHIESIRSIAEIATVNYKDEIVVDTIEYYTSANEKLQGSLERIIDPDEIKYGVRLSPIKRRLTLIIKGNLYYGFDLTDKNYKISQNKDTIWFNLPRPKLLTLEMNPSQTEVFQESGTWSDSERKILQRKAKNEFLKNVTDLKLDDKAKANMQDLIRSMIQDKRKLIFYFDR